MIDFLDWNTLLFAARWVFIGLIYFALFVVLIAVRRELSVRVDEAAPARSSAAQVHGRLKVLRSTGSSPLLPGAVIVLLPEMRLGASEENDIVLQDPYVSARHARIRWDGFTWWIEDLGSRNGTVVDGAPCRPHQAAPLRPKAVIEIGGTSFEFQP